MFKYRVSIVAFAMVFGLVIQASAQNQARRRIINFNLEWYYFGDLVTLTVEGAGACSRSDSIIDYELIEALLKKNKVELLNILRGGQNEFGEPMLFGVIRELPSIQGRSRYKWKKVPIRINLKICKDETEVLVGPDIIILPWPFPLDKGRKPEDRLQEHVRGDFNGDCEEGDTISLLQVDPWMRTVDELLFDNTPVGVEHRNKLIDPKKPDKRGVVLEYAVKGPKRPLISPSTFDVTVMEEVRPIATRIDNRGSTMYLDVGVLGVAGVTGPEPFFEKWPCGAFEPKVGLREK